MTYTMNIQNQAKLIASKLLEIGAVFLKPNDMFTWASGKKSPIYCDNRITLSYPELRTQIKDFLVTLIKEKFPEANLIAGVATAGIPQATLVADLMELPMIYVRPKAKDHGRTNQIEGHIPTNSKIVVIEDLISTGSSSLETIKALQENSPNSKILGLVSIFTYEFEQARESFAKANIPYYSLSNYTTLINTALEMGKISEADLKILHDWRANS